MDGVVATFCGADSPRRSDIARFRGKGVVATLAVDFTDWMNRRQIHRVEAHALCAIKLCNRSLECAVQQLAIFAVATVRTGEELIPRGVQGFAAVNLDLAGLSAG